VADWFVGTLQLASWASSATPVSLLVYICLLAPAHLIRDDRANHSNRYSADSPTTPIKVDDFACSAEGREGTCKQTF